MAVPRSLGVYKGRVPIVSQIRNSIKCFTSHSKQPDRP